MFMRFRGGGIGHVASRHWDTFLHADGNDERGAPKTKREAEGDEIDALDAGDEVAEAEEDIVGQSNDSDSDKSGDSSDNDSGDDKEDLDDGNGNGAIADEGEELDDNVLDQEGYGAL